MSRFVPIKSTVLVLVSQQISHGNILSHSDIDECSSNPCQNRATCNDEVNMYTCTCAAGYNGRHCETSEHNNVTSICVRSKATNKYYFYYILWFLSFMVCLHCDVCRQIVEICPDWCLSKVLCEFFYRNKLVMVIICHIQILTNAQATRVKTVPPVSMKWTCTPAHVLLVTPEDTARQVRIICDFSLCLVESYE